MSPAWLRRCLPGIWGHLVRHPPACALHATSRWLLCLCTHPIQDPPRPLRAALERVALRGCGRVTTAGVYVLLQHRGLKRVVLSKCALVSLESLCSETHLKVVTEPGVSAATAADAALADVPLPLGGLAGQDMQLLVADAPQ